MVAHDLNELTTPALNKLRKATVPGLWIYLGTMKTSTSTKDFWLKQSDNLYTRGKADGLADTQSGSNASLL